MKTTVKQYRLWMFSFGILTILLIRQHFEELENYEECKKIMDAIKEQEERLDIVLPRHITKATIMQAVHVYKKHGLTGRCHLENSEYYRDFILQEIEQKYEVSERGPH